MLFRGAWGTGLGGRFAAKRNESSRYQLFARAEVAAEVETDSFFVSFFLSCFPLSLCRGCSRALSLSLPDSLPPYFWVRTVTADKHAVFQGMLDIFLREVPLSSLQMMKTLGCILRLPRFLGSDCMCLLGRGGHSSIADVILEAKTP